MSGIIGLTPTNSVLTAGVPYTISTLFSFVPLPNTLAELVSFDPSNTVLVGTTPGITITGTTPNANGLDGFYAFGPHSYYGEYPDWSAGTITFPLSSSAPYSLTVAIQWVQPNPGNVFTPLLYASTTYTFTFNRPLFTSGAETVNFNGLDASQRAAVAAGAIIYDALGGDDRVTLPDSTAVPGTGVIWNFDNVFQAGAGNDTITGGAGTDKIDGGADNDILDGGAGNDRLNGGSGNDDLVAVTVGGNSGVDVLDGGSGIDRYYVDSGDTIKSLENGELIYFTSDRNIDNLLVEFNGQRVSAVLFSNDLSSQQKITIENGFSTAYLKAYISNLGALGNSVALERQDPPNASADKLELFTYDRAAAQLKIDELWHNLNVDALKDASGDLLDESLAIAFEKQWTSLATGLVAGIGSAVNVFMKVEDFNDEIVPVLLKAFNGEYATTGEFLIDYGAACYKVFVPFAGVQVTLGKIVFAYIQDQFIQAAANIGNGLVNAWNAHGSGNETATGSNQPDFFYMRGGDDQAFGLGGDDTFKGGDGQGNDRYDGGDGLDLVSYSSATHPITVNLALGQANGLDIDSDILVSIENIIGGQSNDLIVGDLNKNVLEGGAGSDTLNGGAGADYMVGGADNDIYVVDNLSDRVFEAAGGGADRVASSVSYVLAAGQEVERLDTTSAAGTTAINLTGNEFGQSLIGNAGANTLDGKAGADTLQGLGGNDIYVVDNAGDKVLEAVGSGIDRVATSVGYVLVAGQEIERLDTTNGDGTTGINLTGNEFGQSLIGNAGANTLDGKAGADTMQGLSGNDIYVVDNAGDKVIEAVGGGIDRVATSLSYVLAAGQEIERLDTTSATGSAAINLIGNEFGQTLIGNAGANTLDGKGGADTMQGLGGNDIYIVDNLGDRVLEAAGGGIDRVASSVSYVLAGGQEIERLDTTSAAGTAAINLTGNAFGQSVIGNAGANILNGGGGADTLQGLGGNDNFVFRAGETQGDRVLDFAGNGASAGDAISFEGYGTAAQGATFLQLNAMQWQVTSADSLVHETLTFSNAAAIHASDFLFV
ncbi:calcium-binding protein [Bradyrhizobium sp. I1.7.5]|uniref:calcium-binding protein n=1 Tax=Bradyrhizobium sp. I1.7.5 TaxID=3156363 RepID=UPI003398D64F